MTDEFAWILSVYDGKLVYLDKILDYSNRKLHNTPTAISTKNKDNHLIHLKFVRKTCVLRTHIPSGIVTVGQNNPDHKMVSLFEDQYKGWWAFIISPECQDFYFIKDHCYILEINQEREILKILFNSTTQQIIHKNKSETLIIDLEHAKMAMDILHKYKFCGG